MGDIFWLKLRPWNSRKWMELERSFMSAMSKISVRRGRHFERRGRGKEGSNRGKMERREETELQRGVFWNMCKLVLPDEHREEGSSPLGLTWLGMADLCILLMPLPNQQHLHFKSDSTRGPGIFAWIRASSCKSSFAKFLCRLRVAQFILGSEDGGVTEGRLHNVHFDLSTYQWSLQCVTLF